MYFRRKKTQSGYVLQLVQSYRSHSDKPRQRIIASLGDAQIPHNDRDVIARRVEFHLSHQQELIPTALSPEQQQWVDRIIKIIQQKGIKDLQASLGNADTDIQEVDLSKIEHTNSTSAGAELVGLRAWDQLELTPALRRVGFNDAQIRAAQASVINRLVEPVSEHALQNWLHGSSLPDLLAEKFSGKRIENRFDRIGDLLYKNASYLESYLREKQQDIFGCTPAIFLYDLTNTYFEGNANANDLAQRGKSKEKRNDCPLITIAIAFNAEGMPISHHIFAGNQNDGASFPEALRELEQIADKLSQSQEKPLFIMDAGISTAKNLRLLRTKGYDYLVSTRRSVREQYKEIFKDKDSFELIEGKGVKIYSKQECFEEKDPDSGQNETWKEQFLFCSSQARGEKEKAMLGRQHDRFIEKVKQLEKSINEGTIKQEAKVLERLGRIRQQYNHVSRFFEVKLEVAEESKRKKKRIVKSLSWTQKEDYDDKEDLAGCYVMRSNRNFEKADQMWNLYMSLTHAEDGFRCLKSDLGVRPNFHELETRTCAHIFISILALHLLCFIKKQFSCRGDHRNWTSLKRLLKTHCYSTLFIPAKTEIFHIRKLGKPDVSQKYIYEIMGIDIEDAPMSKTKIKKP